jgi:hypothetical protein
MWDGLLRSLETGDVTAWADALADDALVIGSDEVEWWQGKGAAMDVLQAQVRELHEAGVRYGRSDPQVVEWGDVLWVADRPEVVLPDGSAVPARITAVVTRDGGALVIRQLHASVGAPNEEVIQQELTV